MRRDVGTFVVHFPSDAQGRARSATAETDVDGDMRKGRSFSAIRRPDAYAAFSPTSASSASCGVTWREREDVTVATATAAQVSNIWRRLWPYSLLSLRRLGSEDGRNKERRKEGSSKETTGGCSESPDCCDNPRGNEQFSHRPSGAVDRLSRKRFSNLIPQ